MFEILVTIGREGGFNTRTRFIQMQIASLKPFHGGIVEMQRTSRS